MRMRAIFTNILKFETHTGGGDDPDLLPPPDLNWKALTVEEIERRFVKSRAAGREFGGLTSQVYKDWQKQGWYDYFNDR